MNTKQLPPLERRRAKRAQRQARVRLERCLKHGLEVGSNRPLSRAVAKLPGWQEVPR